MNCQYRSLRNYSDEPVRQIGEAEFWFATLSGVCLPLFIILLLLVLIAYTYFSVRAIKEVMSWRGRVAPCDGGLGNKGGGLRK